MVRYHFTPTRMAATKRQITGTGEDVEKSEASHCRWPLRKAVPQNVKHEVTTWPSNATPRYPPKRTGIGAHTEPCARTFTAAWFVIAKKWEPPTVRPHTGISLGHEME